MVTILRIDGLRVVIFLNDYAPAHVHLIGAGGEAKINLRGPDGRPVLVWADQLSRADLRRGMKAIEQHLLLLLQRWNDIHG